MKGGSAPYNNSPEETPEDACSRISSYLAEKYPESSPAEALAALPTAERLEWLNGLSAEEQKVLEYTWSFWCRPNQREPKHAYKILIILAGRGFGKSKASAEIVRGWVESGEKKHIAVVGTTAADVRDTMVEAVYKQGSGIMQICPPWNMPHFSPTKKQIVWTNPNYPSYGAVCSLYSADVPESLRGPSHDAAWVDELCKMRNASETWNMLKFTMRLENSASKPRIVISTTPKPMQLLIDLLKEADESRLDGTNDIVVIKGSTYDNRANLSADFLKDIADSYEGTSLGRQEIYADLILQADGALWTPGMIEKGRIRFADLPTLKSIVVAVDPQTGYRADSDSPVRKLRMVARSTMTGIVTCGLGMPIKGQPLHAYVLRDDSVNGKPEEWGKRVVDTYNLYAQRYPTIVVAESNQGGLMIASVIRSIDPHVRVKLVSSQKKKHERAIPVVAKYQQTRVHHVGYFPQLEQEMNFYEPGDEDDKLSPNRMDACLIGGTMVTTAHGQVPIERIRSGDVVATRKGWKPVLSVGLTGRNVDLWELSTSSGTCLIGTGSHPVYVCGKGFISMDALVHGDILCEWQNLKQSNSTELYTRGIAKARAKIAGITSWLRCYCTERYGSMPTGKYLTATTSTTSTVTRSTTTSQTSNVLPKKTIWRVTRQSIVKLGRHISRMSARKHPNGTALTKGFNSTQRSGNTVGKTVSLTRPLHACSVAMKFSSTLSEQMWAVEMFSAIASAVNGLIVGCTATISKYRARFVGRFFGGVSTEKCLAANTLKHVPVRVERVCEFGTGNVYNLEVADCPEYFANGILVHNCVHGIRHLLVDGIRAGCGIAISRRI